MTDTPKTDEAGGEMKQFYVIINGAEIHFEAANLEEAIMLAADTTFSPPLCVFEKQKGN